MNVNLRTIYRVKALLLMILLCSMGISQEDYQQFTKIDGLPSNECYDVYQDRTGILWIATDRGLVSFDGSNFSVFGRDEGLPNDVVLEIYPQEDGTIWCSTISNELFYFIPGENKFYTYKYNQLLKSNHIGFPQNLIVNANQEIKYRPNAGSPLCTIDKNGHQHCHEEFFTTSDNYHIFLTHDDQGYPFLRSARKNANFDGRTLNFESLSSVRISQIDSYILTASKKRVNLINPNQRIIYQSEVKGDEYIINSGAEGDEFWVSSKGEGLRIFSKTGTLLKTYNFNKNITNYLKDNHGGVWLTTQASGLLYIANFQVHLLSGTKASIIQDVSLNEQKNLVFGNNVNGFFELDKNYQLSKTTFDINLPKSQFYHFNNSFFTNQNRFEVHSDKYGTKHHLILGYSDNRNAPPILQLLTNIVDKNGHYLLEHNPYNYFRISDAEFLGKKIVVAKLDSLYLFDEEGTLTKSINSGERITDVDIDGNKILCATKGSGLLVYDDQLRKIAQIKKEDGLKSNYINEIYLDGNIVWLGTRQGVARIMNLYSKPKVEVIGRSSGLKSNEVLDLEIIGHQLYLGTVDGLYYLDTRLWDEIINSKPKIIFRKGELLANGKSVKSLLNLPFGKNSLEVQYELISFQQREGVSFRYKLVGLDNSWNETSDRKIVFTSLPPGNYELLVQPMFDGIPRDETLHYPISVLQPFYATWWFITLVVLGIITATWAFVRYRVIARNRELIREILRFLMKRLKPKTKSFVVRSEGKSIRINSVDVLFAESNGNYLHIHTTKGKIIIREKISNFKELVPDKLEYIRVRRSVVVRKDKITGKNSEFVYVDKTEIKIGNTYRDNIGDLVL
ncbi:MAG: LytTR family transcriptional regulator DNA-binding domain-containing protein [bacterium]|nr:LytTR family transcriptional regulator DNA-binding domain-containing protein [bacterium]